MLSVTLRDDDPVQIGDGIRIELSPREGRKAVKLLITAPAGVPILRDKAKRRTPPLVSVGPSGIGGEYQQEAP